ncbi:MAG: methyltransferase domain-containing protein [Gemmatimonadota bacterium]
MSAPSPWGRHARQWSRVGPPLRPSSEDVAVARSALDGWRGTTGRDDPTLLLMGVTPELCSLRSGERSRVIAVDRSTDMIHSVWPGRLRPKDEVLCADWRRLPIENESIDVVLSDGCLSTLSYPSGYVEVCAELLRVLRDGGRCVARCFVQSEQPELPADVLADLADGRIGGFHAFKWRLAMALQPGAETGVVLAYVWEALHEVERDLDTLSQRCGWSVEEVRTIDAYRGVEARYSFPSLGSLCGLFADAGFSVIEVSHPSYELGDRCPTVVLSPRESRVSSA